jgi:enterochelin esterase-like enzyme
MFNGAAHRTLDRLIAAGEVAPMVLAAPSDGLASEGTAYLAHPGSDYESWIVDDVVDSVVEMVDEATRASPVFLAGNSMGGFGAARLGARHADRFAGIATHSAITHLDQLGAFTVDDVGEHAGLDVSERDLLDVFDRTEHVPALYLDCGASDPLIEANRAFHRALDARGIPHVYEEFDGGHDWEAWTARLDHSLRFIDATAEAAR